MQENRRTLHHRGDGVIRAVSDGWARTLTFICAEIGRTVRCLYIGVAWIGCRSGRSLTREVQTAPLVSVVQPNLTRFTAPTRYRAWYPCSPRSTRRRHDAQFQISVGKVASYPDTDAVTPSVQRGNFLRNKQTWVSYQHFCCCHCTFCRYSCPCLVTALQLFAIPRTVIVGAERHQRENDVTRKRRRSRKKRCFLFSAPNDLPVTSLSSVLEL
jgi:hypothetical protein